MTPRARLLAAIVFGMTMSLFEAAVVVYLRRLWDLGEVDVTALSLRNPIVLTEVLREAASLGMIGSVAFLAGRRAVERIAHAAVIFGTWDVLYYVFLRLLIGWPSSLLEWDALFLIPRPWIGPVLAPILVSSALVAGGMLVLLREAAGRPVRPLKLEWLAAVLGGGLVIGSFLTVDVPQTRTGAPQGFSWVLFSTGLALALAGFMRSLRRPSL